MKVLIKKTPYIKGKVDISGSKNACLPILATCLLTNEEIKVNNVPNISDVLDMLKILKYLGVDVTHSKKEKTVRLKRKEKIKTEILLEEVKKIRASYYVIPGLLYNNEESKILYPGGCNLGARPIDFHLQAFKKMMVNITEEDILILKRKELIGNQISFDKPSVGATINTIMLASVAQGQTIISNQIIEPEILNVITTLKLMGADIKVIKQDIIVNGKNKLHGCQTEVIDDRIEAGSYMLLASCIPSDLVINHIDIAYLSSVINVLKAMEVKFEVFNRSIRILGSNCLEDVEVVTGPYPNFPTDLQQILSACLLKTKKISTIKETIYQNRFSQILELNKMKANIELCDGLIVIKNSILEGSQVLAWDLRCGFALIVGAILAKDETIIDNFEVIERGYENIIFKLKKIGIKIKELNTT